MHINTPSLFVEINNLNFIFTVVTYSENQEIKIDENNICPIVGIKNNKFININETSQLIKKNVQLLEDKLNYIFKEVTIILDNLNFSCINISGFKKLNGSQVLKENISYILNSLKFTISENEKNKNILHIFNSKSILDGVKTENLPIGLFGDFYNHELSFFLIANNDLKNINQVFNRNNLKVNKIFLKSFIEGAQLTKKHNIETFLKIDINKETSKIIFFEQSAFKYSECFNFGSNIIIKDINKICSIDNEMIIDFFLNSSYDNNNFNENDLLEKNYFKKENYRKIRKKLIFDIADARINEISNIILNKNINLTSFKKDKFNIYLNIQDQNISNSFNEKFKYHFSQNNIPEPVVIEKDVADTLIYNAVNLLMYGWKKEAVPVRETKNSLITGIFKSIFG